MDNAFAILFLIFVSITLAGAVVIVCGMLGIIPIDAFLNL